MNQAPQKVLQYLTGYGSFNSVTVDDLKKLAAENPYFPVSHFLLAQKLKSENQPEYLLQVQKAALYFSNPYWLQYQLTPDHFPKEINLLRPGKIINEISENGEVTETSSIDTSNPDITHFPNHEITTAEDNDKNVVANSATILQHTTSEETEQVNSQPEEEMAAITRGTDETSENFISELETTTETTTLTDTTLSEDLSSAAKIEVVEVEEEMAGVTHNTDKTTDHFLEDLETKVEKKDEPRQDDEHDRMFQNIKAMLDASSEEADADTKNAVISIDPYYTIDYFASQGIKLDLDQNPKDQLGQNLKKFTQWLRHMKKLGPEDATEAINRTETEADIQQIADSSNTVREVVTEAMASVLEKQGKKDKAIELYNKLSFLNPDKSTYFADKIKKLKGS